MIDIVLQSISYRHTVYIYGSLITFLTTMFLSMCVLCMGRIISTNSKEIYAARVVVSSRLHISPSFHLLTMLLYCLLHRIRTNFYGANMHGGKNLCFLWRHRQRRGDNRVGLISGGILLVVFATGLIHSVYAFTGTVVRGGGISPVRETGIGATSSWMSGQAMS